MMLVTSIKSFDRFVRSVLAGGIRYEPIESGGPSGTAYGLWLQQGKDGTPFNAACLPPYHPQVPFLPQPSFNYGIERELTRYESERAVFALCYVVDRVSRHLGFWMDPQPRAGLGARLRRWLGEPLPEIWLIYGVNADAAPNSVVRADELKSDFYGLTLVEFTRFGETAHAIAGWRLCRDGDLRFDLLKSSGQHPLHPSSQLIRPHYRWESPYSSPTDRTALYFYFKPSETYGTRFGHLVKLDKYFNQDKQAPLDYAAVLASLLGYTELDASDNLMLFASWGLAAARLSESLSSKVMPSVSLLLMVDMLGGMSHHELSMLVSLWNSRLKDKEQKLDWVSSKSIEGRPYPHLSTGNKLSQLDMLSFYKLWMMVRSHLSIFPNIPWDRLDWQGYRQLVYGE